MFLNRMVINGPIACLRWKRAFQTNSFPFSRQRKHLDAAKNQPLAALTFERYIFCCSIFSVKPVTFFRLQMQFHLYFNIIFPLATRSNTNGKQIGMFCERPCYKNEIHIHIFLFFFLQLVRSVVFIVCKFCTLQNCCNSSILWNPI